LVFFTCQWLKRADPDHVVSSLWTWIPQHRFMEINRTFGSMAQLVTQMLGTIQSNEDRDNLRTMCRAISMRLLNPYELELIWFIIGKLRVHYSSRKEENESGDESGDDAEKEDVEEEDDIMLDEDGENLYT
jgi:hypothetical protein